MAKVTYLLGAGASVNALPIVNDIPKALNNILDVLDNKNPLHRYDTNDQADTYAKNDLRGLLKGCQEHVSIDTYAKKLFLTGHPNYIKVKNVIILFFELYQKLYNSFDKRYDAFFASILNDRYDKFPKNISILSWNYDNEFEKAYYKYIESANSKQEVDELLNIYTKQEDVSYYDTTGFNIFKLNGSANFFNKNNSLEKDNVVKGLIHQQEIKEIIDKYYINTHQNDLKSGISFSWDSESINLSMRQSILEILNNTRQLVVIGYSFPFFNRDFDKNILANILGLTNIYIQDPDAENIKSRITAINPALRGQTLVSITDMNQFYLPSELSL